MYGKYLRAALSAAMALSYMVPWMPGSADSSPPPPMPNIRLSDGSGIPFPISRYAGNVLVIEFWSNACADCLTELTTLNRMQGDLPGKPVLAIAISEDDVTAQQIKQAMARQKLTFLKPFGDPGGNAAQLMGLRGLPTSFVVDRHGRVVMQLEGPQRWDRPDMEKRILYLAAQP